MHGKNYSILIGFNRQLWGKFLNLNFRHVLLPYKPFVSVNCRLFAQRRGVRDYFNYISGSVVIM